VSDNTNGTPTGVDQTLRDRVMEQIAIVQDALDAAVANPTDDHLDELREVADQLMRALARVLLEIERQRSSP
jgi:DNA-binding FrmR family transcriptional regulator